MSFRKAALLLLAAGSAARAQEEDLSSIPMLEAVVEGERQRDPAGEGVRGSEAKSLPGAHGDALVAAQMLPGVAREPVGTGQLVVWGAAPRDTRLLIDGIEVPALYHANGLRSVIPAELVKRIDLSPAAFGAHYGRAIGGVLSAELEVPQLDSGQMRAALDPLDAHLAAQAGGVFAGARYSLLDRIAQPLLSDTARELFPLPRYFDAQLVAALPLRSGERIDLLVLGASDTGERAIEAADPSVARGDSSALRWGRVGARYRRSLPGGADASAVAWLGDELESQRDFAGPAFAGQTRWAQSAGMRASWRAPVWAGADLTIGADSLLTRTRIKRSGSLTAPAREGDVAAFGQAPGADVAFDDWTVLQGELALHASLEASFGRLLLTPGIRLAADAADASRLSPRVALTSGIGLSELEWFAEPRLSLQFRASDALQLFAAGGLHHQPPAPEDLSAVFGAPMLGSSSAWHTTAGATLRAGRSIELEATGFFRSLDALASRSNLPTPRPAQALVQEGTGLSYGAQLVARSAGRGPLSGFVSALVEHSERQDHPGGAVRAFDFDQPLALTAAAAYKLAQWTFGARLRVSSGYPRTPITGAYFDARLGVYDPLFGAHNAERLPAFAQLDLRAERRFGRVAVSLEVQNLTARKNAEEFAYSSDWSSRGAISGLPTIALLGLEVTL